MYIGVRELVRFKQAEAVCSVVAVDGGVTVAPVFPPETRVIIGPAVFVSVSNFNWYWK
jgi:hypothetical protein